MPIFGSSYAHVSLSHSQPLFLAHWSTLKCPFIAADAHVSLSHSQPLFLAHWSTSKCPLCAAFAHVSLSHSHPFFSGPLEHFQMAICSSIPTCFAIPFASIVPGPSGSLLNAHFVRRLYRYILSHAYPLFSSPLEHVQMAIQSSIGCDTSACLAIPLGSIVSSPLDNFQMSIFRSTLKHIDPIYILFSWPIGALPIVHLG